MLAEYIEVEEPTEIIKPITQVRFKADYDITDALRRWGNWSRKNYYSEQKTSYFYCAQDKKYKEVCTDNYALMIDAALISLSKVNKQGNEQYKILKLFYFGEALTIEDYVATTGLGRKLKQFAQHESLDVANINHFNKQIKNIIKPLSVVDIAKKLDVDRAKIKSLKEGGENYIVGYLSAINNYKGEELAILNNSRACK